MKFLIKIDQNVNANKNLKLLKKTHGRIGSKPLALFLTCTTWLGGLKTPNKSLGKE